MATTSLRSPVSRVFPSIYQTSTNSTLGIAFAEPSPGSTGLGFELGELSPWRQEELRREQINTLQRLRETFVFGTGSKQSISTVTISMPPSCNLKTRQLHSTLSISKLIASIRASLSLQIKELAEILQVERPTIYAWIKEQSNPHKQNRERLSQIYHLVKQWDRLSNQPIGKAIHDIGHDGRSLFDYFKEFKIPEDVIISRFTAIKRSTDESKQHDSLKVRKSVFELAREHGIDLTRVRDQEGQIDVLTGKRVTLD